MSVSAIQHSESVLFIYMNTYIPSLPLPHRTLSITEHQAELPVLHSSLHMVVCVCVCVCVCQHFSPNSSHPPLSPLCPQVPSLSASLFLPCKQVHLYHFFLDSHYTSGFKIYLKYTSMGWPGGWDQTSHTWVHTELFFKKKKSVF